MWGRGTTDDYKRVCLLYQMGVDNGNDVRTNIGVSVKRAGTVTEKIYYYPENITDAQIATGNFVDQMLLLDPTQYSVYKRGGDFAVIVSCNRRKVLTDDFGNEVVISENSPDGIFTRFAGFMTLEISDELYPLDWESHGNRVEMKPIRQKLKFPQYADAGKTLKNPNICVNAECDNVAWRQEHYSFTGGGLYSVSRFHGIVANRYCDSACCLLPGGTGFINGDSINVACCSYWDVNAGIIQTNDYGATGNTSIGFPSNSIITGCDNCMGLTCVENFGANWMNLSVYLPQTGWVYNNYNYIYCWMSNSQFTFARKNDAYYMEANNQLIAGKYTDTCSFARSDLNWTDFVPMTKQDVAKMNEVPAKGFKTSDDGKTITTISGGYPLHGTYRNGTYTPAGWSGPAPFCGGRCNGSACCGTQDPKTYFFKGIDISDCVAFITCLGII
jgi:hypothetical protein